MNKPGYFSGLRAVEGLKTRIAPTPSGFLHIGNLYSFTLTLAWVKMSNGRLLLRIDDLDADRMRQAYIEDIFDTLQFMRIYPDEGPSDFKDFIENYSQKRNINAYRKWIDELLAKGLAWHCKCSRKETSELAANGLFSCACKAEKVAYIPNKTAIKLNVPHPTIISFTDYCCGKVEVPLHTAMGNFVVQRKEGIPAFLVASLFDDLQQGCTGIVRGLDLQNPTAAQLYLARLLQLPSFEKIQWLHHPLQTDANGEKLSKSAGATSIQFMRNQGATHASICRQLANLFGVKKSDAITNMPQLLESIIEKKSFPPIG